MDDDARIYERGSARVELDDPGERAVDSNNVTEEPMGIRWSEFHFSIRWTEVDALEPSRSSTELPGDLCALAHQDSRESESPAPE
jgi:hypothetical protein